MKKQTIIITAAAAAAILVALIIGLCCVDWKSEPTAKKTAVEERMDNPEYVAKLERQAAERTRLIKELSQARKAYLAAQESGLDAATLQRLKANWDKASRAFQVNDQVSQLIVREEMLKQKK